MDLNQRIELLLEKVIALDGYGIVRVNVSGNLRKTLQIMIERLDGENITVEDCEKVSRLASPILDVEDVITEAYTLEVSSPGIDRPLTKPKHFIQFEGHTVVIQTNTGIKNRKKFKGILANPTQTGIKLILIEPLDEDTQEIELMYADIRSARLHVEF